MLGNEKPVRNQDAPGSAEKARQIHAGSGARANKRRPRSSTPTAGESAHDRPLPPPVSVPMTVTMAMLRNINDRKIAGQKTANQNRKRQ